MYIYLAGPAGSGKSTAAKIFDLLFGFHRYRMSDVLRIREHHQDRAWLQAYGDRLRAVLGEAALAMIAHQAVITDELLTEQDIDAVIDGVRLPEEAKYLQDQGYLGIRIDTPDEIRNQRRILTDSEKRHHTEQTARHIPADVIIENTGSMQDLVLLIGHEFRLRSKKYGS